jgi:hypothetical protein
MFWGWYHDKSIAKVDDITLPAEILLQYITDPGNRLRTAIYSGSSRYLRYIVRIIRLVFV